MKITRRMALQTLRERKDFLRGRINSYGQNGKEPNGHDWIQFKALDWALDQLIARPVVTRSCRARIPVQVGDVHTMSLCGATLPCEAHSSDVDHTLTLATMKNYDEVLL